MMEALDTYLSSLASATIVSTTAQPRLHYLFIIGDGDGSQPPALAIGQQLQAQGHTVSMAGVSKQQRMVEGNGFTFVLMPQSDALHQLHRDSAVTQQILAFIANPAHLQEMPAIVQEHKPDVILCDFVATGCMAALEVMARDGTLQAKVLLYGHSTFSGMAGGGDIPLPLINQMRSLSNLPAMAEFNSGTGLDRVIDIRRQAQLKPQSSMLDVWRACLRACPQSQAIVCSIPELETAKMRSEMAALTACGDPVPVRYIGPQIPAASKPTHIVKSFAAAASVDQVLSRIPRDEPLVLASFTSRRTWDQVPRIKLVIEAVRDQPYQLLITYGEQDMDQLQSELPANVHLISYAPHSLVLPRTAVCVTHCGHGTAIACLTFGVPIVALPNAGDQPLLANEIANLQAGVQLPDPSQASVETVRAAIDKCVHSAEIQAGVRRVQAVIALYKQQNTPLLL